MIIDQLQPYLNVIPTILSIATLGFILVCTKMINDIAQGRVAILDERVKLAADRMIIVDKEKSELKEKLDIAKKEIDLLLMNEGIDLTTLSLGRKLSESAISIQETAHSILNDMQKKLKQLSDIEDIKIVNKKSEWDLSIAMGEMAFGKFADAATYFDASSKNDVLSWSANFTRGIAHANTRGGFHSDIAALRAYNEAIALIPDNIDENRKARIFSYRGAMFKRLNRFDEAKADLEIALSLAKEDYEISDTHYNLACIFSINNEKDKMMSELNYIKKNKKVLKAIKAHRDDYFANFADDPDFISIISM